MVRQAVLNAHKVHMCISELTKKHRSSFSVYNIFKGQMALSKKRKERVESKSRQDVHAALEGLVHNGLIKVSPVGRMRFTDLGLTTLDLATSLSVGKMELDDVSVQDFDDRYSCASNSSEYEGMDIDQQLYALARAMKYEYGNDEATTVSSSSQSSGCPTPIAYYQDRISETRSAASTPRLASIRSASRPLTPRSPKSVDTALDRELCAKLERCDSYSKERGDQCPASPAPSFSSSFPLSPPSSPGALRKVQMVWSEDSEMPGYQGSRALIGSSGSRGILEDLPACPTPTNRSFAPGVAEDASLNVVDDDIPQIPLRRSPSIVSDMLFLPSEDDGSAAQYVSRSSTPRAPNVKSLAGIDFSRVYSHSEYGSNDGTEDMSLETGSESSAAPADAQVVQATHEEQFSRTPSVVSIPSWVANVVPSEDPSLPLRFTPCYFPTLEDVPASRLAGEAHQNAQADHQVIAPMPVHWSNLNLGSSPGPLTSTPKADVPVAHLGSIQAPEPSAKSQFSCSQYGSEADLSDLTSGRFDDDDQAPDDAIQFARNAQFLLRFPKITMESASWFQKSSTAALTVALQLVQGYRDKLADLSVEVSRIEGGLSWDE